MTVDELYKEIENEGIIEVLRKRFGKNINVKIAYSKHACETSVDELSLSVRSLNALKRTSNFTLGDLIDCINREELLKIRNLGIKSYYEICLKLLEYGYMLLTQIEKQKFIKDLIELNQKSSEISC